MKNLLVSALLLALPAGSATAQSASEPAPSPLAELLNQPLPWPDLTLRTVCPTATGTSSWSLYGDGFGIRNRRHQHELSGPVMRSLVEALVKAGFWDWEPVYGSNSSGPLRVVCQISVEAGGLQKSVRQLNTGKAFGPLRQLAERIDRLAGRAKPVVSATSVSDAIEKLSRGRLRPEVLTLTVHRRLFAEGPPRGWIFRISGRRLQLEVYGSRDNRRHDAVVSAAELAPVIAALSRADPASLPINLYSTDYVDVTIEVLGRRRVIQARQFSGLDPDSGDGQATFDQLLETIEAFASQVFDETLPSGS